MSGENNKTVVLEYKSKIENLENDVQNIIKFANDMEKYLKLFNTKSQKLNNAKSDEYEDIMAQILKINFIFIVICGSLKNVVNKELTNNLEELNDVVCTLGAIIYGPKFEELFFNKNGDD